MPLTKARIVTISLLCIMVCTVTGAPHDHDFTDDTASQTHSFDYILAIRCLLKKEGDAVHYQSYKPLYVGDDGNSIWNGYPLQTIVNERQTLGRATDRKLMPLPQWEDYEKNHQHALRDLPDGTKQLCLGETEHDSGKYPASIKSVNQYAGCTEEKEEYTLNCEDIVATTASTDLHEMKRMFCYIDDMKQKYENVETQGPSGRVLFMAEFQAYFGKNAKKVRDQWEVIEKELKKDKDMSGRKLSSHKFPSAPAKDTFMVIELLFAMTACNVQCEKCRKRAIGSIMHSVVDSLRKGRIDETKNVIRILKALTFGLAYYAEKSLVDLSTPMIKKITPLIEYIIGRMYGVFGELIFIPKGEQNKNDVEETEEIKKLKLHKLIMNEVCLGKLREDGWLKLKKSVPSPVYENLQWPPSVPQTDSNGPVCDQDILDPDQLLFGQ
ncbi:hypothetical protein DdX_21038 [Ditylenchus destructor]|uniref:Uncharacterized protein n=1 Tax=Ditylenchus destructor TaxID=166010 RepID=A0AAD4QT99_9BILA|nr:hypothetical protein DdX_21038 [Ditylenchus destructor]